MTVPDSTGIDTVMADTVAHDTTYVIIIEADANPDIPVRSESRSDGLSWIIGGLLLLFTIAAIRFRKNSKFLAGVLRDATDTRERGNVFDDTVRETLFIVILNIIWCVCAGIMLYAAIGVLPEYFDFISPVVDLSGGIGGSLEEVLICIGVMIIYQAAMTVLYMITGNIFSDRVHARMWLHGLWAVTGLSTILFFPAALMTICYPGEAFIAISITFGGIILMKILLIRKCYRIFFTKITSWVLFLYYLCSLEVVPIIMVYFFSSELIKIFG